jgi:cell division protein FtsW
VVGLLIALGILMVLNVTYFYGWERYGDPFRFFRMHLISVALGGAALMIGSRVPLSAYRYTAVPLLAVAVVAMIVVLSPLGVAAGGAQRWLYLAGFSVQPSEVAKLAVVIYVAWWLARNQDRIDDPKFRLAPPLAVVAVMAGLLLLEPDFGTAVLLGVVLVAMLFVAGVPLLRLGVIVLVGASTSLFLAASEPYRWRRLVSFLNPWADPLGDGWHLRQSLLAFGSGGITGIGLGESRAKMFYLPAAHTDFIFSVIGEELGLIGALIVLSLFCLLALRGIRIALRHLDPFGRLLAFGLTALLGSQALVNAGVVLGLLPTKGLVLPFVSYGGSAMVVALTAVGILYGLSREVE